MAGDCGLTEIGKRTKLEGRGRLLEDWHRLWDAMVRSEGHEMIVDDYIIPPAEVRVKVAFFLREARHKIVADLREMALRHPEQRAWTETLALRYERWEEET